MQRLDGCTNFGLWVEALDMVSLLCNEIQEIDHFTIWLILNVHDGLSDLELGKQVTEPSLKQGYLGYYDLFCWRLKLVRKLCGSARDVNADLISILNNHLRRQTKITLSTVLSFSLLHIATAQYPGNQTDLEALVAFARQITDDPFGFFKSWNNSAHFCQWSGVRCNNQRVTNLFIADQKLAGVISPYIGNLCFLQLLDLSNNSFTHEIPPQLGCLQMLQTLVLRNNLIGGEIPANLSACTNLKIISIEGNKLQGQIPDELGSLGKLRAFGARNNYLTGCIPLTFGNLSYLKILDTAYNSLMGSIPSVLGQLKMMEILTLNANKFSGKIPISIFNLSSLITLEVRLNKLDGYLPSDLGNCLPNLVFLGIGANNFTGPLPVSISNISNLRYFVATQNKLTGKMPSFTKLHKLKWLAVTNNSLGSGLTNDLSFISFLTNATDLEVLHININNFGGELPESFSELSTTQVDLSDNHLVGSLPMNIGNFKNLGSLDVSNNNLSGEIPSTLGRCTIMQYLNMGGNNFQGGISSSLSSLQGIHVLDLSSNHLSGQIPKFLESFNLKYLNLSFNDFEDALPREGIFKNSSAFFVYGNSKLCGGLPEMKLPLCNGKRSKKGISTHTLRIIILIALGLLILISAWGILLFWWLRRKKKEPLLSSPEYSVLRISYQSLIIATNWFNSANLVGTGSFGSVYRGILDDKYMAVKVLNNIQHEPLKNFMAECEALRNIRHRNLVRLLNACSDVDYEGNDFKAVVYELMVNGSLEWWLHSPHARINAVSRKYLNLLQRLNIAIDVASALDYLHHHCQMPIIHYNIKPSNVLLDNEMIAQVGDFGFSRLILKQANSITKNHSGSDAAIGTTGYAPPEYGMGSEVSIYGDIYSFGILVLEMFTGKKPNDDTFVGNLNLRNFAKLAFFDGVGGVVDPILLQPREERDISKRYDNNGNLRGFSSQIVQECFISVLRIGIACSMESPAERMDLNNVTTELRVIRDCFIRTTNTPGKERAAIWNHQS